MQYQEFVDRVKNKVKLTSDEETTAVIRTTLETLVDHLAGNAPAKLAAQLPSEIGEFITSYKRGETAEGEGFGVEEFVARVAAKTNSNDEQSIRKQTQAVLEVLREAVSEGEFNKMRGTLPAEYDELFGADNSNASSAQS